MGPDLKCATVSIQLLGCRWRTKAPAWRGPAVRWAFWNRARLSVFRPAADSETSESCSIVWGSKDARLGRQSAVHPPQENETDCGRRSGGEQSTDCLSLLY